MRETLLRRFTHEQNKDDGKFASMPDLILLDGGIAQLNAVKQLFDELNIDIPLFGMVKDDRHRTRGVVSEQGEALLNPTGRGIPSCHKYSDEVHRFAIEYHRKLHEKKVIARRA